MPNTKFSAIALASSTPSLTDTLIGVGGGTTDLQYTFGDVASFIGLIPTTSNMNFYVATTGSDSNPGTVGSPFLTIQHAINVACQFNWNFLWFPTINVANGTYTQQLILNQLLNCPNGGVIVGNVASQNSVVIADTGTDYAIQVPTGIWTVSGLKTTGTFGGLQTSGTLSVDHISIGGNLAHECIAVDYGALFGFFGESITIVATNANGGLCFSRGFFGADGSNITFANAVTFGDSANSTMSGDANLCFYACDALTFTNGSNVTMNPGANAALTLFNGAFFEMDSNTKVDGVQLTRANFPGGTTTQNVDPFSVFQGDNLASRVFSDLTIDEAPFSTTASNNAILNLNGRLSGTLNQARIFADFNGSLNLQPANGLLILDNVGVLSIDPGVGSANAILSLTARLGGVAAPEVQVLADELGALHLITQVGGGQDISLEADSGAINYTGGLFDTTNLTAFGSAFGGFLSGVKLGNTASVSFSNDGTWFGTIDAQIARNGVNILEINNGTPGTFAGLKASNVTLTGLLTFTATNSPFIGNDFAGSLGMAATSAAAKWSVYNSFTNSSNYEGGVLDWQNTTNVFSIGTKAAGTGTLRPFQFISGGTNKLDFGVTTSGVWSFQTEIDLIAGSTTVVPIKFKSGTLNTTAVAGVLEFDGTAFYNTSIASSRQVSVTEQVQMLSGTRTFTNNTSAQAIFNATANGAVTLAATTTYEFEMLLDVTGFSTSSHNVSLLFGGSAAFTSIEYLAITGTQATVATPTAPLLARSAVATAFNITGTVTTANSVLSYIRGTMRVNTGGTVIPQLQQVTASAAAVVQANSFFRCWPIGTNTVTNVGNWS